MRRIVVIGNPENRRVRLFRESAARWPEISVHVLAYRDLLEGSVSLERELRDGDILRIESPGENFEVDKLLLAAGAAEAESAGRPFLPATSVAALDFDPGLILYPQQWFSGYVRVMFEWSRTIDARGSVRFMNHPSDILDMFDKAACHSVCSCVDLPLPEEEYGVSSYDDLVARMEARGWQRVFVKLSSGSSASGAVALYRRPERQEALTTAEIVRTGGGLKLYNSLRIRRYTLLADIRELIDELCRHGVHVEQWLPKASLDGRTTFDLRMLQINRQVDGFQPLDFGPMVIRQSRTPFTNLHLGNARGSLRAFYERLSEDARQQLQQIATGVFLAFTRSHYLGLDILFTPGLRRAYLLEVNAFGDLLPGVLHDGLDTYSCEIAAMLPK